MTIFALAAAKTLFDARITLMSGITKTEIKLIRSLSRRKVRDSEGLFVVEGEKTVQEALESGLEVVKLFRRDEIGEETMRRISFLDSPSPALALVRKPSVDAVKSFGGLCLALDSVRDPGNMGTILRIADWFGVKSVYASPDSVDCYNPKAVQASMGSVLRVPVNYLPLDSLITGFRNSGVDVFGTFLDGDDIYAQTLPSEALIVMGSESFGISPALPIEKRLRIPSFSNGRGAESLNVAVATAITLSEFRRQNHHI